MLNNTQLKNLPKLLNTRADSENTGAIVWEIEPSISAPETMLVLRAVIRPNKMGDTGKMIQMTQWDITQSLDSLGVTDYKVSDLVTSIFADSVHWDTYVHFN